MSEYHEDVIEILTRDHREVEEMFGEFIDETKAADRRRIADDITIELVRHAVAEEMYLYPAVRQYLPDGDKIADKELADHAEIERALKDLEEADAEDAEFEASMRRLIDEVTEHVEDEEHNLFPQLAKDATREDLVELGEKVRMAKAVAPTRPHPAAPDRPPLNKLLAPGAGLIDRVRDQLSGRGGH